LCSVGYAGAFGRRNCKWNANSHVFHHYIISELTSPCAEKEIRFCTYFVLFYYPNKSVCSHAVRVWFELHINTCRAALKIVSCLSNLNFPDKRSWYIPISNFMKIRVVILQLYWQTDKMASLRSCITRQSAATRKHLKNWNRQQRLEIPQGAWNNARRRSDAMDLEAVNGTLHSYVQIF